MRFSLKALRVNANLTMSEASKRVGISRVTLRSYETNKTMPNIKILNKLLALYDASLNDVNLVLINNKIEFDKSANLNTKHDISI